MADGHSEEVEHAIWRMHQAGEDLKCIAGKLKVCDLFISRKCINLAIRRGQLMDKLHSNTFNRLAMQEETPLPEEEMEIDGGNMEKSTGHTIHVTDVADDDDVDDEDETEPEGIVSPEDVVLMVDAAAAQNAKAKPRRAKTTDDLILRLQEDFQQRPDVKVKDRAAKFGIAVGTLCQIKHNILKMPKESGRTWKSTPQMVDAIKEDISREPNVKVKQRAQKFGISVGTLCRIMHDLLEYPKRVVQRSGAVRAPRGAAGASLVAGAEGSSTSAQNRSLK